MLNGTFPRMIAVRQDFPSSPPIDFRAEVRAGLEKEGMRVGLKPGARIAVCAGSRGIANYAAIVGATVSALKDAGAAPFIVPAMGSHGNATPEGQREVLAGYGITEESMGVPIRPSMEVRRIATTPDGLPVFTSAEALDSDGIVIVNRVKPHTDFIGGTIGSGLQKMLAIGLGKQKGAATCHASARRVGYERTILAVAGEVLRAAPVIGGVAIVEDAVHGTAKVEVVPARDLVAREEALYEESRRLMPRLPFDEVDLLVIDRIGKDVSGSGMDPNVTGRGIHGYNSWLADPLPRKPAVRRILVLDLTAVSHGNATGIGMADFTTARLVKAMDLKTTYTNVLTAMSVQTAKIPIHFETDREAVENGLASLLHDDPRLAKIVRILDTVSLRDVEVSEAYAEELSRRKDLAALGPPAEMAFDAAGNLAPLRISHGRVPASGV